jgi:hypothetical protein
MPDERRRRAVGNTWRAGRAAVAGALRLPARLKANPAVWYFRGSSSGNNSVVECDLAKVEVAGSNPVSRSNFLSQKARAAKACRIPAAGSDGAVAKW